MLPSIQEAETELKLAGELNPGPWVKHSVNVGIAARNIAHKLPNLDENKEYDALLSTYEGRVSLRTNNRGREIHKRIHIAM